MTTLSQHDRSYIPWCLYKYRGDPGETSNRILPLKSFDERNCGSPRRIVAWKTRLAADRTSCPKATANQFQLFLHAGAYWLLWSLRALMPKTSSWRVAQFDM